MGFNRQKKISELEGTSNNIAWSEKKKEMKSIISLTTRTVSIPIYRVPEGEERRKWTERVFQKPMA